MSMQLKNIITLSVAVLFTLCCNAKDNSNIKKIVAGKTTEITYSVGFFNKIISSANTKIVFSQAKKCSIKYVSDLKARQLPKIEVADSTLRISHWSGSGTFYVSAPDLTKLKVSGMSSFTATDLNLKNLYIKTDGQSAINLEKINCTKLGINASGMSSNTILGSVTAKKVRMRYAGQSVGDIAGIKADTIKVEYTGLSSQHVNFDCAYLNMDIHGNVSISGDVKADKMNLDCHGLSNIDMEQSGKNVTIHNHGSATLKLRLNCELVKAKNSGMGNIILSGVADSTKIVSSGNSRVNTFYLNQL